MLWNEYQLQYYWNQHPFREKTLKTADGRQLRILHPGSLNTSSGPDFFNAEIQLGKQKWFGNIELHLKSSDWIKHGHQNDSAYNNVILHVVMEHDAEITLQHNNHIPVLELKKFLRKKPAILESFPCTGQLHLIEPFRWSEFLSQLYAERMQRKIAQWLKELNVLKGDIQELFYRLLAAGFGMNTNSLPFHCMAVKTPYATVRKHRNDISDLEALFFGQSGLLPEKATDYYSAELIKTYSFLQVKYQLHPVAGHSWKFMRMRPVNFPTIRIAQFSMLLHSYPELFHLCVHAEKPDELYMIFNSGTTRYWENHYRFGVETERQIKHAGEMFVRHLLINAVIPVMHVYGITSGGDVFIRKAAEWMEALAAEENAIVNKWKDWGVSASTASCSQALTELHTQYCILQKCNVCRVMNCIREKRKLVCSI